jgi:phosphoribosylanthranilate isomerase
MITQIYAVTSFEEAKRLVEIGVDYIGVVVGISGEYPGVLNLKQAGKVLSGATGSAKKVILPFTENPKDIITITQEVNPDILHIAVEPSVFLPADMHILKRHVPHIEIMRTIPVVDEKSIDMAKEYDGIADYLLLDTRSKKNNQIGITGETHDWDLSKNIVQSVFIPVILAGGLGSDNVADAILAVDPFGVDSKTKTDKAQGDGKDVEKVESFVKIAKATNIT